MTTFEESLEQKGFDKASKDIARRLLMQPSSSVENVAYLTNLPVNIVIKLKKEMQGK